MEKRDIDMAVAKAFEAATPDVMDRVIENCDNDNGKVMVIPQKKNNTFTLIASMVAVFVAVVGLVVALNVFSGTKVAATVLIDVNPSIEIQVDEDGCVIKMIAKNSDAEAILEDMDFEGSRLEVAVNAIVGSMLKNGYLSEIANSILVSVDCEDKEENDKLCEEITDNIEGALETQKFYASILCQDVEKDEEVVQIAKDNDISVGKAKLVKLIADNSEELTVEELSQLSINELKVILESLEIELKDMKIKGKASREAYITEEEVRKFVGEYVLTENQIDIDSEQVTDWVCNLKIKKDVKFYTVEFIYINEEGVVKKVRLIVEATEGIVLDCILIDKPEDKEEPEVSTEGTTEVETEEAITEIETTTEVETTVEETTTEIETTVEEPTTEDTSVEEETKEWENKEYWFDMLKKHIAKYLGVEESELSGFTFEICAKYNWIYLTVEVTVGEEQYKFVVDGRTGRIHRIDKNEEFDQDKCYDKWYGYDWNNYKDWYSEDWWKSWNKEDCDWNKEDCDWNWNNGYWNNSDWNNKDNSEKNENLDGNKEGYGWGKTTYGCGYNGKR